MTDERQALIIQVLQDAYLEGEPKGPVPRGAAPDQHCIRCHRIDVVGSLAQSEAAIVLQIGPLSLPVMLEDIQLRQLGTRLLELSQLPGRASRA